MHCDNCHEEVPPAYTLRAHVDGGEGAAVDLRFCSFECLQTWT